MAQSAVDSQVLVGKSAKGSQEQDCEHPQAARVVASPESAMEFAQCGVEGSSTSLSPTGWCDCDAVSVPNAPSHASAAKVTPRGTSGSKKPYLRSGAVLQCAESMAGNQPNPCCLASVGRPISFSQSDIEASCPHQGALSPIQHARPQDSREGLPGVHSAVSAVHTRLQIFQ